MPSGATARGDVIPVVFLFNPAASRMSLLRHWLGAVWLGAGDLPKALLWKRDHESVCRAVRRTQGGSAGGVYSARRAPPGASGSFLLLSILLLLTVSTEAVDRGLLASLLPSTFWAYHSHTPPPPLRPCHPVLPVGTCEPGGGGYQWWRAELDHQEEGGTAVLAQAALFIIPHHLELGLNPPQQLELV